MALQSSGQISLSDIQGEFGGSNPISLSEYYRGGSYVPDTSINLSIPTSGQISLSDFYGGDSTFPKGYWAGGLVVGEYSGYSADIDGLLFSSETAQSISMTLSVDGYRAYLTGVNNDTEGLFAGGYNANLSVDYRAGMDGIYFPTEGSLNYGAAISNPKRHSSAGACSGTNGYIAGGIQDNDTIYNRIDEWSFYFNIFSIIFVNLATARKGLAGVNSSTKGYFGGGSDVNDSNYYTEVDGILFSNETAFDVSNSLTISRTYLAGANSSTYGYFVGGYAPSVLNETRQTERISFSTETISNMGNILSVARQGLAGVNSGTRAYFGGGDDSGVYDDEIDAINFVDHSAYNPTAVLADGARSKLGGVQSGGYY